MGSGLGSGLAWSASESGLGHWLVLRVRVGVRDGSRLSDEGGGPSQGYGWGPWQLPLTTRLAQSLFSSLSSRQRSARRHSAGSASAAQNSKEAQLPGQRFAIAGSTQACGAKSSGTVRQAQPSRGATGRVALRLRCIRDGCEAQPVQAARLWHGCSTAAARRAYQHRCSLRRWRCRCRTGSCRAGRQRPWRAARRSSSGTWSS